MKPKMLAVLGETGLLLGYEDADPIPDPLPESRVVVPRGCDLVPGRYRWDGRTFQPLSAGPGAEIDRQPDTVRAIWRGFKRLQAAGVVQFDRETVDWIEWYGRSLDAMGT